MRLCAIGMGMAMAAGWLPAQQGCETLRQARLPHTEIVSAEAVAAGPFTVGQNRVDLPGRCVVKAVARPTSDSAIGIEVWLPATGWNGRYQQVGNGGWAGSIPAGSLAAAIRRGYAAAGTDDGHTGGGAAWAIGHPEKLIDFGHRALHETTLAAKALIRAYYGREIARSYFVGCSDGGREALMEAQRYPEEFDGILAGAPANDWSHLFTGFIWNMRALMEPGAAIPPAKLPAIQRAAVAACDRLDGVTDGLIENPRACRFDPAVLTCRAGDSADCLTAPQVEALRKIYAGPKHPRTGEAIYPGFATGTEASPNSWGGWIIAPSPEKSLQYGFGTSLFGQAVYENPQWDIRSFDLERDMALADRKVAMHLNSTNPDLRSFRARGGKLLQYHGWGDAAIPAEGSIVYYQQVRNFFDRFPDARSGRKPVEEFYRLFLVPGLGHCAGGIGAIEFGNTGLNGDPNAGADRDALAALVRWVEQGQAPERIVAAGRSPVEPSKAMTRPLCPFPQVARYRGSGDPLDAASFTCAAP